MLSKNLPVRIPNVSVLLHNRRYLALVIGSFSAFVFLLTHSWRYGPTSPRALVSSGLQRAHDNIRSHGATDAFADYNKGPGCNFSSLDLHHPFSPLCQDRQSLLDAMSGGGRLGWDEPYWTRGCDMQWFSGQEICEILGRFDHIYIIGDSIMRHIVQALQVLLRRDLVDGGRATWRDDDDYDREHPCHCHRVFDDHKCMWMSAIDSELVLRYDPASIPCKTRPALLSWVAANAFPLDMTFLNDVFSNVPSRFRPNGRDVFLFGHGVWNEFSVDATMAWLEQIEDIMAREMPAYFDQDLDSSIFPRLFITSSAQQEAKPDFTHALQNNIRVMRHVKAVSEYVQERGYEHLGLYNMTIQATSPDGTHASLQNNLVKAMFVLNWLNMLDTPPRSSPAPKMPTRPQSTTSITKPTDAAQEPWLPGEGDKQDSVPDDQALLPDDTDPHPIDRLITAAERDHDAVWEKQSEGIAQAAAAYRRRRGRHPPPGFDKWVQWAEERDVIMVEDLFDQLYHDIEPFWALEPDIMHSFPRSWGTVLSIRNGAMHRWEDESAGTQGWMDMWAKGLQGLPLADLPDVDLAFNVKDEPKLFVPWEAKDAALKKAEAARKANPPKSKPAYTEFQTYEPLPASRPHIEDRKAFEWADHPDSRPLWDAAREACHPGSTARTASSGDDLTEIPRFSNPLSLDYMIQGYVSNWTASKSVCENPQLRNLHGSLIAMLPNSDEIPRTGYRAIITQLVPLLAGSKIHDITSEIVIPPAFHWPSEYDAFGYTVNFAESARIPWAEKKNALYWRGSASGGINTKDNWTHFHRHRFFAMLNGTLVARHQHVVEAPKPKHVPGGRPVLPHHFPLPNASVYPLAALEGIDPPNDLGRWVDATAEAGFVHLRCDPPSTWFTDLGGSCSYDSMYYGLKAILPGSEGYKYKFHPDIDGNAASGMFRAQLHSNSLPIKATIYDEWHTSRLTPWRHFVPLSLEMVEWWGLLEYFLGYQPLAGDGQGPERPMIEDSPAEPAKRGKRDIKYEPIDMATMVRLHVANPKGGHDAVARRIAEEGSAWSRAVLRNEDMLAYMYRLILEMARLGDERRDHLGFADDMT